MPKMKSPDVKDRAKAGMEAFGKGKQKLKGPMTVGKPPQLKGKLPKEPDADDGAPPGTYIPHMEPDADDKKKKGKKK